MKTRKAKRDDALLGDPPSRGVVRVVDLVGRRGGTTYVLALSCGHWRTARKLPSGTEVPCVGCLVDAAMHERRATWEDVSDRKLLQLGRSAVGTSRDDCLVRQLVAVGIQRDDAAEVRYARKRCASLWNARFARAR